MFNKRIKTFDEFLLEFNTFKDFKNKFPDAGNDRFRGMNKFTMGDLPERDLTSAGDDDILKEVPLSGTYNSRAAVAKELGVEPYQVALYNNSAFILRKEATSAYKLIHKGEFTDNMIKTIGEYKKYLRDGIDKRDGSIERDGFGFYFSELPEDTRNKIVSYAQNMSDFKTSGDEFDAGRRQSVKDFFNNAGDDAKERFRKEKYTISDGDAGFDPEKLGARGLHFKDRDKDGDWYSDPEYVKPMNREYLDYQTRDARNSYDYIKSELPTN